MSQRLGLLLLMVVGILSPLAFGPAHAAQPGAQRALDLALVIDNSCSMFPAAQAIRGCEVFGNDPDFRRILGANLFIARLGFAEANEDAYQMAVVSFGAEPRVLAPLQPLSGARDALANLIANPQPELATQLLPALRKAYNELRRSPNRRPANVPAVVLITDGVPFPLEGQSSAEIEQLVAAHPDIPLFMMLLQNPSTANVDYSQYIDFWRGMQSRYANVFTYDIGGDQQIVQTYNQIVAQLQESIPTGETAISPGQDLPLYVPQLARRIIITAVRSAAAPPGAFSVFDPSGAAIVATDPGVRLFQGVNNPVEVMSIDRSRLRGLTGREWVVRSSQQITVSFDFQGAYRIAFRYPPASLTSVANVFFAADRAAPDQPLRLGFQLIDVETGALIAEPQTIGGALVGPDGTSIPLSSMPISGPDAQRMYTIVLQPDQVLPADSLGGRLAVLVEAGTAVEPTAGTPARPISTARLLVDVGRGPFIAAIAPARLACGGAGAAAFQVSVGNADLVAPETIRLRLFLAEAELMLAPVGPGQFAGELTDVCQAALAQLPCGTAGETSARLRLTAQLASGEVVPPVEQQLMVALQSADCAPIARPTATPPPAPLPPPAPWPVWVLPSMIGAVALGLLALWRAPIAWPWVSWPAGYLMVLPLMRASSPPSAAPRFYDLRAVALQRRRARLRIGGARQDDIVIAGLKPGELLIGRQGSQMVIGPPGGYMYPLEPNQKTIPVSKQDVEIRVALERQMLKP